MMWPKRIGATIAIVVACTAVAGAQQWNDRTILKFDAPVMVPGTTLPPGTYTFQLLDSTSAQHTVQIFSEDGTNLITTAQAIPTKRLEPTGDVVIKLNPTEAGAPVAIKSWFYPGSLYGHEFVYPDEQARNIAQRTKTLVLSSDVKGSDKQKGTLYTYDAEGRRGAWKPDAVMLKDWERWNEEGRAASARVAAPGEQDTRKSTAPMVQHKPEGTKVALSDLEENPNRYTGQTINVTAEVEDVFGPRLFKIDEPNWGDLDGEVLVYLPTTLAAIVREDDRVTVTGTMKMFVKADLERELAFLEPDPDLEMEFAQRPVLVASQIVGGDSNVALAINVGSAPSGEKAVGTTGTTGAAGTGAALTDAGALASGGEDLVGRQVNLQNAKVTQMGKNHGFWIESGGSTLFVLPQHAEAQKTATAGQTLSIDGIVLQMPRSMRDQARGANANTDIYIYARTVK